MAMIFFGAWAVGTIVGLYKAFILMHLWNWFVAPVFHLQEISFLLMLGLLWTISLLTDRADTGEEKRWKVMHLILDKCVPEHRRDELTEELKAETDSVWFETSMTMFASCVGYTATLALGWFVHILVGS